MTTWVKSAKLNEKSILASRFSCANRTFFSLCQPHCPGFRPHFAVIYPLWHRKSESPSFFIPDSTARAVCSGKVFIRWVSVLGLCIMAIHFRRFDPRWHLQLELVNWSCSSHRFKLKNFSISGKRKWCRIMASWGSTDNIFDLISSPSPSINQFIESLDHRPASYPIFRSSLWSRTASHRIDISSFGISLFDIDINIESDIEIECEIAICL